MGERGRGISKQHHLFLERVVVVVAGGRREGGRLREAALPFSSFLADINKKGREEKGGRYYVT